MTAITFTFGDRLRRMRLDAGLSRSEMADTLGISPHTVTNYETDKTLPTDRRLKLWAEACDADPDLLIRWSGWLPRTPDGRAHLAHVA